MPAPSSVRIAGVVGSILVAINLGPTLVRTTFTRHDFWRVVLNYLVPLVVAEYSRRLAMRGRGAPKR